MGAIEAFALAAQLRTLTAAAGQLNLSVSALSRRIQSLETYIGVPLFERLHHELRLTSTGEQLAESLAPAIDALSQALYDVQKTTTDHLTIGVPPSFAAAWLLPRFARFRGAYPTIEVSFDSSGAPLPRLNGGLDAAIVFAESLDRDLYARVLKPQTGFAVCAPGFLPAGMTPAIALATQTLLVHSGLPKILPAWLAAMRLSGSIPQRIESYDSGPMLIAAAENGLGIALTLEDAVRFYPGAGRLEQPFGEAVETPYSYWFVCRKSALAGRALLRFHDWLFAEIAMEAAEVAKNATAIA